MDLIKQAEAPYRSSKLFGVQFHLDEVAYECDLGDRITFEDRLSTMQGGRMYNFQNVYLDGEPTGAYLEESYGGGLFDPMVISFHYTIADCCDECWIDDEVKKLPNFYDEGECYQMRFATLQQLMDYLKEAGVLN